MTEQTKLSLIWTVVIVGVLVAALGFAYAFGWITVPTGG